MSFMIYSTAIRSVLWQ